MVTRLHLFDGSEGNGLYSFYEENQVDNRGIMEEIRKNRVSGKITEPLFTVPALQHYRLIYESPTPGFLKAEKDIRMVKIFERVYGVFIQGEGTIEIPIQTNQGREFIYRQQSRDGQFILPYSTKNNPYGVVATGPYTIVETGETFPVDESELHNVK
ncbi:MAG: hypothetical protein JXA44_07050 [Methanospirillaceae archaeon]|nr:hypothetical protein [Methanospirillaceae archaeon]